MKSAELGAELEVAFLDAYPDMPEERVRHMARNLTQRLIGEAVSICGLCMTACPWTQRYLKHEMSK